MRLLLDIDVILDVMLEREPWVEEAARLLSAVQAGRAAGSVAGHTITTVYYLVTTQRRRAEAVSAVEDLLRIVDVVPVETSDFHHALALGVTDFEDAVQAVCALKIEADVLVTRNVRDYRGLSIAVERPGVVLARLSPSAT